MYVIHVYSKQIINFIKFYFYRSQFHDAHRSGRPVGYIDPTRVCRTQHTVSISADSQELKGKTKKQKENYIKKLQQAKRLDVAAYLANAMLGHAEKNVLMVPYALT